MISLTGTGSIQLIRRSWCVVLVTELSKDGHMANAAVRLLIPRLSLIVSVSGQTSLSVSGVIIMVLIMAFDIW